MPGSHHFDNLDYSSDERIIFSDLCYLFKPGEYIYKPLEGEHAGRVVIRAWGRESGECTSSMMPSGATT